MRTPYTEKCVVIHVRFVAIDIRLVGGHNKGCVCVCVCVCVKRRESDHMLSIKGLCDLSNCCASAYDFVRVRARETKIYLISKLVVRKECDK